MRIRPDVAGQELTRARQFCHMAVMQGPKTEQRPDWNEPMQKTQAVASLGQHRLMLPAWVKAALAANDRLKVYLTVLQSASSHASHPNRDVPDLSKEIAAAGLNTTWLHDVAAVARRA